MEEGGAVRCHGCIAERREHGGARDAMRAVCDTGQNYVFAEDK